MRRRAVLALAFVVVACRSKTSTESVAPSATRENAATADASVATRANDMTVAMKTHPPKFHRAAASACAARPPVSDWVHDDPKKPPSPKECAKDADCTKGKNGRCLHEERSFRGTTTGTSYRCSYDGCNADADCGAGNACICRGSLGSGDVNVCAVASCKTDAECGAFACSPSFAIGSGCRSEGGSYHALVCHGPADECSDDSDCVKGAKDCAYSEAKKHWVCDTPLCLPD